MTTGFLAAVLVVVASLGVWLVWCHLALARLRQAAAVSRENEARFRAMVESTSDWVWEVDAHGCYTFASPKVTELLGYPPEEVIGRTPFEFMPPGEAERIQAQFLAIVEAGETFSGLVNINLTRDGREVVMETSGVAIIGADGELLGYRGIDRDITQRRKAEAMAAQHTRELERGRRALLSVLQDQRRAEESLRQLALAVEQSPESIVITNVAAEIEYVNAAFLARTGYTRDQVIGQNPRILQSGKTPRATYDEMWAALTAGQPWRGELINRKANGEEYIEVVSVAPLRQPDGRIGHYVAVKEDTTERRRAEEERENLRAQLAQAQKMESVGRLAGGVAHDFNNMLGVIMGHVELAMLESGPDEPLYADLEAIQDAGRRSSNLTRQLLTFARHQTVAPKVLDLNEAVEGMLKMLRRLVGEDIDLAWRPGSNLGPVCIDPSQVDQILANLCVNARDAIADVGRISIETGAATLDATYVAQHPEAALGEYILLTVSDDGCGMDAETRSHIFEPFFTTKEIGKGTGLGLATVYGAVKQNNGFISFESEPGHGTTFRIHLPRHTPRAAPRRERERTAASAGGGETILLVEDEPATLKATTRMLERMGYAVIATTRPGEAIRLAQETRGRIDLLMTDVVMPEMNGRDLAANLESICPDIKRLFMSGYTAGVIARHNFQDDGEHFIAKPFQMKELAAKIRESLG